ncbi:MAG: cation diffusion facilitator family transporter [Hyphomicrobiaceae bacterium]
MAAAGSTRVVIAALAANAAIAVAKFAAAAWTGSAAMLSEAIHSLADTANQGLLLHGIRRASRPADARHPFGYAKELYFWAFVVAILLFSLGAGVAIYEGIDKLRHPHPVTDPLINYAVLGVAIIFEVISTVVAVREFNTQRQGSGMLAALRTSKDPALFTVLLENLAAIAGLLVALTGIAASHLLGWSLGDAIASIIIGLILGLVAAFMAVETKGLLIGEAASPALVAGITALIQKEARSDGPLAGVGSVTTMHLGPDHVVVAVPLDFRDAVTASGVEATVARLEAVIRRAHPEVKNLFLEARPTATTDAAPATVVAARAPAASAPAVTGAVQAIPARPLATAPPTNYPPPKPGKAKKRKGRR